LLGTDFGQLGSVTLEYFLLIVGDASNITQDAYHAILICGYQVEGSEIRANASVSIWWARFCHQMGTNIA
jgi:hypothetical protein